MQTDKKKGFTIVELLMGLAVLSAIIGIVITMMSRGASNVQKGSFTALAANQAAWICSVIRNDMARSDSSNIEFEGSDGNVWSGNTTFKVVIEGGAASYSLEKRGAKNKVFVRKFVASNSGTAFAASDNKLQTFGDEYMTDMTVTLATDSSYIINITMDEPGKHEKDGKEHEFKWTTTIYPPEPSGMEQYWIPTVEGSSED